MHRQLMQGWRELMGWVNVAFDARPILRQLTKSQESDQFCSSFTFVNDGEQVQSVQTQCATAVSPGGEFNCWPVLREIMQELAVLRKEGAILDNLVHAHDLVRDVQKLISNAALKFRVTITVDGAMMFKISLGKCGGSARKRCPCCPMIHDIHANDHKGEYTDHFAYILVEVTQGETYREFAKRNGVSLDTIVWSNEAANHSALKTLTSKGGEISEPDLRKPWGGLSKILPDDPMRWSRGKRLLRGRFRLEMDRELVPELAENGFSWKDVCCCVVHGTMRRLEWNVYHILRTADKTMAEINEWAEERELAFRATQGKEHLEKPTFNYVSAATVWLKPDPCNPDLELWESLVDFADEGREDTKEVWESYLSMREIQQLPYPSPAQIDEFEELTFDMFIAHVTRYEKGHIDLYLHFDFMHAPVWMRVHKSLALHANQAAENLNSLHKTSQSNGGTHGGLGGNMCLDALETDARRIVRNDKEARILTLQPDLDTVTHEQWCDEISQVA